MTPPSWSIKFKVICNVIQVSIISGWSEFSTSFTYKAISSVYGKKSKVEKQGNMNIKDKYLYMMAFKYRIHSLNEKGRKQWIPSVRLSDRVNHNSNQLYKMLLVIQIRVQVFLKMIRF